MNVTNLDSRCRKPSYERKKKLRSFLIGPPRIKPAWTRLYEGSISLLFGPNAKGFLASSDSLRTKAKTEPCKAFVPDFETILINPPLARPNSAEKFDRLI